MFEAQNVVREQRILETYQYVDTNIRMLNDSISMQILTSLQPILSFLVQPQQLPPPPPPKPQYPPPQLPPPPPPKDPPK